MPLRWPVAAAGDNGDDDDDEGGDDDGDDAEDYLCNASLQKGEPTVT